MCHHLPWMSPPPLIYSTWISQKPDRFWEKIGSWTHGFSHQIGTVLNANCCWKKTFGYGSKHLKTLLLFCWPQNSGDFWMFIKKRWKIYRFCSIPKTWIPVPAISAFGMYGSGAKTSMCTDPASWGYTDSTVIIGYLSDTYGWLTSIV